MTVYPKDKRVFFENQNILLVLNLLQYFAFLIFHISQGSNPTMILDAYFIFNDVLCEYNAQIKRTFSLFLFSFSCSMISKPNSISTT